MSADNRTVSTDALETLGTIIDDSQKRDAIHLAVFPAVAACDLRPGLDVGLMSDGTAHHSPEKFLGIVDPFLSAPVLKGQRFWLVVYPRQISSLRHVWEHPAFPASGETEAVSNAPAPAPINDMAYSVEWMKRWAVEHMGDDYYGDDDDKVSPESAYAFAINAGHNMSVGPYESARDEIDSEWWDHWERITGEKGQRGEYFSCGC